MPEFKFGVFFYGIILLSIIESLYCILQSLGVFKSHSLLFLVTGSYNNPNVTAIFLALTTPAFLYFFRKKYKWLIRISFFILVIALFLLKCRAAFIGTIVSVVVFYSLEYNMASWIKKNKNKPILKALFILSFLIIIPLSSYLYNAKKDSADGRKFIWKVSTVMALEKPLMGYGYGYFEKEYNLYQADYIKKGKTTPEELKNAGPVIMPHNELLHNLVEGGFIGLILTGLFFGSLFFAVKRRTRTDGEKSNGSEVKNSYFNISYSGVIAFIGMSMVNSTVQIMPIMALLIIYAAIICSKLKPLQLPLFLNFRLHSNAFPILYKTTIIVLSCYLLCIVSGMAIADRENKKASILQEEKRYKEALQIMHGLENYLSDDRNYWKNLGIIYIKTKNYQQAIDCFSTAKKWSSLPDLYFAPGMCYEKLHDYPKAIAEYKQLVLLLPSKFGYRFRLMQAYFKNKDIVNTAITAKEILALEPKIPSAKVKQYKKTAWYLLKKIESEEVTRKKS
ncbi:O-antigen ligase family protein [Flavobacterium piscis]|uniref:O-antigen ligase n=1 Tax=Flavobacterium piscis TaxID=1114874 RepID=A0ABU1YCB8_9FLAO|nr:O-antigen ligase family protein [Flavobacterium piscis]MDR7211872.1 O-antigen ligase [Flavobacterium piscis]